jgi:dTDP-4-amino-4,6-dideoxygalactose transaminase
MLTCLLITTKSPRQDIIEDNAQGFGACYHEKMTGTFGHINAHSFYPTKNLGAIGDAGIITTDDEALYEKSKVSRNYGSKEKYINEVIGHNSRLDEIQAAILNVKLKHCDKWINEKRDNAARYIEGLKEIGDIILPVNNSSHTHHLFVIRIEQRDRLREYLMKKNITTLIHYPLPPHRQTIYNDIYKSTELSIADTLARTSLSLPNYIGLKAHQIDYIIDSIREYFL